MFKKNLENSFAYRLKERILNEVLNYLPTYRKNIISPFLKSFLSSVLISGVSYLSYLFLSKGVLTASLVILSFFSFLLTGVLLIGALIDWYDLKKNEKLFNMSDFNSELLNNDVKHLLFLNKEEIKELFTLNLTSEQLDYLQKIIIDKKNISLCDFEFLSTMLTKEEEALKEQQNILDKAQSERNTLNDFLSEYDLAHHPNGKELIERFIDHSILAVEEKQMSLNSRL